MAKAHNQITKTGTKIYKTRKYKNKKVNSKY